MNQTTLLMMHGGIASLALLIYLARGVLLFLSSPKRNSKGLLGASSFLTLILFFSGVTLAMMYRMPFDSGFVLTKIIGLLLFVGIGILALKQGMSKPAAIILWLTALGIFIYIFSIAKKMLLPLF